MDIEDYSYLGGSTIYVPKIPCDPMSSSLALWVTSWGTMLGVGYCVPHILRSSGIIKPNLTDNY